MKIRSELQGFALAESMERELQREERRIVTALRNFVTPDVTISYNKVSEGVLTLSLPDGRSISFTAVGDDATYLEIGVTDANPSNNASQRRRR